MSVFIVAEAEVNHHGCGPRIGARAIATGDFRSVQVEVGASAAGTGERRAG